MSEWLQCWQAQLIETCNKSQYGLWTPKQTDHHTRIPSRVDRSRNWYTHHISTADSCCSVADMHLEIKQLRVARDDNGAVVAHLISPLEIWDLAVVYVDDGHGDED